MVFAGINDYARAFVFVNADAQKAGRDRPENVRRGGPGCAALRVEI